MIKKQECVAMLLAGGQGSRLKLLTDSLLDSSKPTASVPEQIEALEGLFLDL